MESRGRLCLLAAEGVPETALYSVNRVPYNTPVGTADRTRPPYSTLAFQRVLHFLTTTLIRVLFIYGRVPSFVSHRALPSITLLVNCSVLPLRSRACMSYIFFMSLKVWLFWEMACLSTFFTLSMCTCSARCICMLTSRGGC